MKKIMIPTSFGQPVVKVTINDHKYTIPTGIEVEVEDSVADFFEDLQSRQKQVDNDPPFSASWNDLEDRPFYDGEETIQDFFEKEITFTGNYDEDEMTGEKTYNYWESYMTVPPYNIDFSEGDKVFITWDGEEYEDDVWIRKGCTVVGSDTAGYDRTMPFYINLGPGDFEIRPYDGVVPVTDSLTVKVKLRRLAPAFVKTIDPKYLPDYDVVFETTEHLGDGAPNSDAFILAKGDYDTVRDKLQRMEPVRAVVRCFIDGGSKGASYSEYPSMYVRTMEGVDSPYADFYFMYPYGRLDVTLYEDGRIAASRLFAFTELV